MNKRITIKEALETWQSHGLNKNAGNHIPSAELYELMIQPRGIELGETQLNHLTSCPQCLREIKDMVECRKEAGAWDVALPKAAATETEWPKKIRLEGGKYTVTMRRNLHEENKGLVVLEVEKGYQKRLEGRSIQLLDGQGLIRLEGIIFHGKLSQEIEDLDTVNLKRLTVRPGNK
jgi:hypothetical protein